MIYGFNHDEAQGLFERAPAASAPRYSAVPKDDPKQLARNYAAALYAKSLKHLNP